MYQIYIYIFIHLSYIIFIHNFIIIIAIKYEFILYRNQCILVSYFLFILCSYYRSTKKTETTYLTAISFFLKYKST